MAQFVRNSSASFCVVPSLNRQIVTEGFKSSSKHLFYKRPVDNTFSGLAKGFTKNFGWINPRASISITGCYFNYIVLESKFK